MASGGQGQQGLIGRDDELRRLGALVDGARAGRGGALLIEGRPGTGKSALLAALDLGGVRAVAVTGVETEIDLPLAGLTELLHPLLDHLPALPAARARVLRGALALDEAAIGDEGRVVLLHAVLALVEAAAAAQPLVLAVDDVQWLDPSSREAIAFVARRAHRLGAAVIAVRSLRGAPAAPWPDVERLLVDELPRGAALELARRQGLAAPVAEALVDAVGGNALALVEAPAQLTPRQRSGVALLPQPLPAGERLQRLHAARVAALPPQTRRALLLAAASADGDGGPVAAALGDAGGLGAPDAPDGGALGATDARADSAGPLTALAPAEDAGLVVVEPRRIRFTHPLVRSAVYHAATPTQRRAAHLALAAATDGPARAWHRAVAADAPDEEIAAALEALAFDAQRRGAPATASAVLQRAAQLTPAAPTAVGRLLAAAAASTVAGEPQRARSLLDPLVAQVEEPGQRADVQLLRGMAILQAGHPMEAFALLEAEADAIEATDPARAAVLLTQACVALVAHGSVQRLAAIAVRAVALAPAPMAVVPETLHAQALVALGDHRRARDLLAAQRAALAEIDPIGPAHELLSVVAMCHLWMEDHAEADAVLNRLVRHARAGGAAGALALPLSVHAALHLRRGAWERADAAAAEAVAIVDGTVRGFAGSFAFAMAANVDAQRGRAEACRANAARVLQDGGELELTSTLACAEQALGLLALGDRDAETAVLHFERARAHTRALGSRDPSFLYTAADLAEALVRAGRPDDAGPLADELAAGAELTGGAWAAAAAARCRALVAPDLELDALLSAALVAHARVTLPFELARTQLCFGERLRRARRRSDARALLASAHATFVALGATAWATRASNELAATGARRPAPTPRAAAPDDDHPALTVREHEVCALVAGGATNREVAAALFLSPRTVEHHLRMAYRKLGVRSRTELVRSWVAPPIRRR